MVLVSIVLRKGICMKMLPMKEKDKGLSLLESLMCKLICGFIFKDIAICYQL